MDSDENSDSMLVEEEDKIQTCDGQETCVTDTSKKSEEPLRNAVDLFIAEGVYTDCENILKEYLLLKTSTFEDFARIWKEKKFTDIYTGKESFAELLEFSEEVLAIAKSFILPPHSQIKRIGALYLMYGLYTQQPLSGAVKYRVTPQEWSVILKFVENLKVHGFIDANYIFHKMSYSGAFLTVANAREYGLERNFRKYFMSWPARDQEHLPEASYSLETLMGRVFRGSLKASAEACRSKYNSIKVLLEVSQDSKFQSVSGAEVDLEAALQENLEGSLNRADSLSGTRTLESLGHVRQFLKEKAFALPAHQGSQSSSSKDNTASTSLCDTSNNPEQNDSRIDTGHSDSESEEESEFKYIVRPPSKRNSRKLKQRKLEKMLSKSNKSSSNKKSSTRASTSRKFVFEEVTGVRPTPEALQSKAVPKGKVGRRKGSKNNPVTIDVDNPSLDESQLIVDIPVKSIKKSSSRSQRQATKSLPHSAVDEDVPPTHLIDIASKTLDRLKHTSQSAVNEFVIIESIKHKLLAIGKEEVATFCDLHRKLKTHCPILKKRAEIIALLSSLSDITVPKDKQGNVLMEMPLNTIANMESLNLNSKSKAWEKNWENNNATNIVVKKSTPLSTGKLILCLNLFINKLALIEGTKPNTLSCASPRAVWSESPSHFDQPNVSEQAIIQELLYSFQGIEGKVLKRDATTNGFYISHKFQLSRPQRRMVERLAELGWLHNKLDAFREADKHRSVSKGLIAQALNTVISSELTEFYRILADLQSQLHQQTERSIESPMSEGTSRGSGGSLNQPALTLLQLEVHTRLPFTRLRWLVSVCEACQDKKGGALVSTVHGFLRNGDKYACNVVHTLLVAVCKPLYAMLSRWILDGELEDPFQEFFIQTNLQIKSDDQLWHEKYKVRESMVPSFISMAQARKILATGKSINFLRQVCEDHSPVNSREMLRQVLEKSSAEALFALDQHSDLQSLMDTTYLEISRRVLDVLNSKYKFMEHMQALRRYLLLGQGDFIRHLMEILEPELRKPASELTSHSLSGILESAIRATNAQFEDASILQRLDVRLLEHSPGDTGWDIFSMDYNMDGPIGTVFSSCTLSYLMLFNALWRAKRIEWILSLMWKRLTTSAKMLPRIPELSPVLQQLYLLSAEMIHMIHQLQYYFLFEVMECSWDKLISNVQQADGLDDIIKAHNQFLARIKAGALVDDSSEELSTQLRTIYDLALQLQAQEEKLHVCVIREVRRRAELEKYVEEHGTNKSIESQNQAAIKDFEVFLSSTKVSLRVLAQSYQEVVKKFLLLLASHPDISLQLLSSRLDFNDHYKRHDTRLAAPLTYQHRRQSEISTQFSSSHLAFRAPSEPL
ncbi:Gamma-tubulin complex component 3 [Frankliniella fusca]|uniref:Gamma-tubulin complex component 3 n=1 Tax=Frankliniella fusca TaxID=407009 RepID=A0AAE1L7Z9_9NEOP|nr:Gamma-tubulin complex component 3 [Frankliniella fusca]